MPHAEPWAWHPASNNSRAFTFSCSQEFLCKHRRETLGHDRSQQVITARKLGCWMGCEPDFLQKIGGKLDFGGLVIILSG